MNRAKGRVVVIGGGHAGLEAACAASRIGADVTLVTLSAEGLVRLSCNPAIGGIGKGHLVREIDALGGIMGRAADRAGIHFRMLNRRRGPAVQGPRVQLDLARYPEEARTLALGSGSIEVVEGEAIALQMDRGRLVGVETSTHGPIAASAAVLTTGTFLRGKMFRGEEATEGGRTGEGAALEMSRSLASLGLRLGRFKTGTPPRIERQSIDFDRLSQQPGDGQPIPLSFGHLARRRFTPSLPQVVTYLTETSERAHDVVRQGLDRSPLYSGRILAEGPRYCPSFEDKVVKFPEKPSHLLHLEPMGLDHPWIYVNGLSTSLPEDLQKELVHRIQGLESARIARYGYAVEYDYVPPTQLDGSLRVKSLQGLYLAGQICGTTGYEEAAALGLVAGANAARHALGESAWQPDRLRSYIGVMVDDLTTRGVLEPYRMFTSRAELRISLSADTADLRLSEEGARLGLVAPERERAARLRWDRIDSARARLERVRSSIDGRRSAADMVRSGGEDESSLRSTDEGLAAWPESDLVTLRSQIRYTGYLEREQREAERLRRSASLRIPSEFDFSLVRGLRTEIRERLEEVRPTSVGQASRVPGVTPAALALLAARLERHASSEKPPVSP